MKRNSVGTSNLKNREVWLEKTLNSIPEGLRILDAGAGELRNKKYCTHLDYVSHDFAQYDGKGDGSALQTQTWDQTRLDIISDITNIPEPDSSFDAIMCIEVFEHLPEPVKAIKEFRRLLKQDGQLVITAPFCSLTHFAPFHYYSGFNNYFYQKLLKDEGFEVVEIEANGNYFEFLAQEIRRTPQISNKYCNYTPSLIERFVLKWTLRILAKLSAFDQHSRELLCYGYHVRAIKNR